MCMILPSTFWGMTRSCQVDVCSCFPVNGIRRSFQDSTADYLLFWASAGQFLSALTGVRWKNVGYCDSPASFCCYGEVCVGEQKGERVLRERNRT